MACPKVNPRYPSTASRVERPIAAMIRKLDPDFDVGRRQNPTYNFSGGRRQFRENALLHGAYVPVEFAFSSGFSIGFDTLDVKLRIANGFCGEFLTADLPSSFSGDFSEDFGGV